MPSIADNQPLRRPSGFRRLAELPGSADEIGHGLETEFHHHAAAMYLDGVQADPEIGSDLFVEFAGENVLQHLSLARS